MSALRVTALVAAGVLAPAVSRAQTAEGATVPILAIDDGPRSREERVALAVVSATTGFRVGTGIGLFAGLPRDEVGYWVLPSVLAVGAPIAALLIERRFPVRRGRVFTAIEGTALGFITSLALTAYLRGESSPSYDTISGLPTFLGTTLGLGAGIAAGPLFDPRPGPAMYSTIGTIGGGLFGLFGCGVARCGTDLGLYALVGTLTGTALALTTQGLLRPSAYEMRLVAAGAILGATPAIGVGLAYLARDGDVSPAAFARVSAFALGGLTLGAVSFYFIARQRRTQPRVAAWTPTVEPVQGGAVVGLALR